MRDSNPIACDRCGVPHLRCTAHNRAGQPCKNIRMRGQTICRMHGGNAPQNKLAAERRMALATAEANEKAMIAYANNGPGVEDPLGALAKLATEALAMKDALAARVNALSRMRYKDQKGAEQLRSEVALYERALDRSARFLDILARSGFEEARVRLEEQKGILVAHAIRRILDQLELTPDQRKLVSVVVPEELRAISQQVIPGTVVQKGSSR